MPKTQAWTVYTPIAVGSRWAVIATRWTQDGADLNSARTVATLATDKTEADAQRLADMYQADYDTMRQNMAVASAELRK